MNDSDIAAALSSLVDGELCGGHHPRTTLTCTQPKGHVKTFDDWHEASAKSRQQQNSLGYELILVAEETVRWAPHRFEIPKEEKDGQGKQAASDQPSEGNAGGEGSTEGASELPSEG